MPSTETFGHLLRAVYERPWAISESALHSIVGALTLAAAGQIDRGELAEMLGARPLGRNESGSRSASVAIVPVHGVISQGQGLLGLLLGGTSVDEIAGYFRAAMNDRQVDAIVLDVNSPGGTIDGVEELASLIRASRGRKPIVAAAQNAESAAYWLASAADEITITPSGRAGSIGVFTAHQDISEAAAKAGVKTTLISYGKHKVEGNPFEPLSDEAKASMQERVDYYGRMFERAVAKGRGVSVDKVRAEFGQGRSITAETAVRVGLADREATLDDTIHSVGRGVLSRPETPVLSAAAVTDEQPVLADADLTSLETEPEAATRSGAWMRTKARRAIASVELNF